VTEIVGREGDTITTQDIFIFKQSGMDEKGRVRGSLEPTGIIPTFQDEFELSGVSLSFIPEAFRRETAPT
jgi:pilus assembly protein CpaF